jgi:hypothetical protein
MLVRIDLTVPSNAATVAAKMKLVPGLSPQSFEEIARYFDAIAGGAYVGRAVVTIGANPAVTVYNGQA